MSKNNMTISQLTLTWLCIVFQIVFALLSLTMVIVGLIGCADPNLISTGSSAGDICLIVFGVLFSGCNALFTLLYERNKKHKK